MGTSRERRVRQWLAAIVGSFFGAAGFLTAPEAMAATTATFSGTGAGSSQIAALDPGVYSLELSYSQNTDRWGATNFISDLETVSGDETADLTNDIAASGSFRQVIRMTSAQSVWLDVVEAAQGAVWSVSLNQLSSSDANTTPDSASLIGRNTTGLIQLPVGLYAVTAAYSQNTDSYGATNFIMSFEDTTSWQQTIFNDIAASGSVTKNLRITTADLYWFNVSDSAQSTQWSISLTPLVVPTPAVQLTATPTPTISGKVKVGRKLTAKAGTWKPSGVTFAYQWYRNNSTISGATHASYKLTKSDRAKKIKVAVTGSKPGYPSVTRTSKPTSKVKK